MTSVARDIVRTLRHPSTVVPHWGRPWAAWWCVVRLYAIGMVLAGSVVAVGVRASGVVNKIDQMESPKQRLMLLVLAGVIAPLWEETAFRLPLAPFHWARALPSLALLSLLGSEVPAEVRYVWFGALIVGAALVLATTFLAGWRETLSQWWGSHFRWVLALSVVGFGFAHGGNYIFPHHGPGWFAVIPLLVLPQLIAGALLAYVRLRLGFWFGVLLHASVNTALVGASLLAPNSAHHAKPIPRHAPHTALRSKPGSVSGSRRQPPLAPSAPARSTDHASTSV